jgi:hypothetical protein
LKQGINLASQPVNASRVLRAVGWLVLIFGLAGSIVHLHLVLEQSRGVGGLREDVEHLESRLASMELGMVEAQQALGTPASTEVLRLLAAVEASGATRAASPARVLTMLAQVFPPEARLLSLKLRSLPPQPELILETMAESPESAARLLGELSHQSTVIRAAILDERHLDSEEIYLRIRVDLGAGDEQP